jgi:hypothetical protein
MVRSRSTTCVEPIRLLYRQHITARTASVHRDTPNAQKMNRFPSQAQEPTAETEQSFPKLLLGHEFLTDSEEHELRLEHVGFFY